MNALYPLSLFCFLSRTKRTSVWLSGLLPNIPHASWFPTQLRDLVSLDLSANQFSGALPLLRPDCPQPALRQMRLHGNDDLLAPNLWLHHETPRCV